MLLGKASCPGGPPIPVRDGPVGPDESDPIESEFIRFRKSAGGNLI